MMNPKDFIKAAMVVGCYGWNGVVTFTAFSAAALAQVNGLVGIWAPLAVLAWPFLAAAGVGLWGYYAPPGGVGK